MVTDSSLRHFLTLGALLGGAALLVVFRPRFSPGTSSPADAKAASCLRNLSQISRAVALYSRDFNGKIPRGVDPEDHFKPQNWNYASPFGAAFRDDALQAPFLHRILRPYLASDTTFHCPADSGWIQTRLPGDASAKLRDVLPTSFSKYGTSYYYSTIHGFKLECAVDISRPSQTLLLFDGDLWHSSQNRESLNGLFIDGHVQNLNAAQFDLFSRE
ncbi:prepilin-type processing-associated H-X9-DG domain-containing protein [Abditibacterium utsteinense]|uniref:Prepilin-type processing-associated H-X9-DG domain-containing protein n=1 Tax=Abditibacterium utsteinense TaxID=1960156 RepID=A0A2S8SQV5_9BACT|nr:hypothetical protein [Abditibacterium utsteinense]PQV63129.1 prepilin-type processing-associated H-X9-DG domain-containing protein [Abditibacterium utsteinense]